MKRTWLTLALAAIHLAVFAQGKVTTGNDANHLVVFAANAALLPARYAPYAGQPVPQLGTPDDQFKYFTVADCDSRTANDWITLSNIPAQPVDAAILISDTMIADERFSVCKCREPVAGTATRHSIGRGRKLCATGRGIFRCV